MKGSLLISYKVTLGHTLGFEYKVLILEYLFRGETHYEYFKFPVYNAPLISRLDNALGFVIKERADKEGKAWFNFEVGGYLAIPNPIYP
jgi:hypothetical protein